MRRAPPGGGVEPRHLSLKLRVLPLDDRAKIREVIG